MTPLQFDQTSDAELVVRFEACRDELAFQELVRRHGPMVIATARRIVQNSHDADDVFQATFLALATASLRHKVAVGSWLYRTAVRCGHSINRTKTAWDTKIKRKMERHEEKTFDPDAEPIRIVIDQELAKLPEKIRAAIVLCYLEGITRKEAAMRLGIPSPTLNDRIAKGKELLASRLVRRGVIGSVGGFTVYVKSLSKSAAQPMNPALVADISSKALQFSAGKPWSSVGVSEIVGHTATEVIKAMTSTKLVAICILALAIAMGLGYPLVSIFGITSSVASASTIFIDTFDDGDYADNAPTTWTLRSNTPGALSAASGDLVISPNANSEAFVAADAVQYILGDTSVRTQGRITENGGSLIVTARNQVEADTQHYFAGAGYYESLGGSLFFAGRNGPGTNSTFFGPNMRLPFDVRTVDAVIQLDVIGDRISAWAWQAGEEMPDEPMMSAVDSTYSDPGFVRLALGNTNEGTGNSSAVFRYVHVADAPIVPEPATAAVGLVLATLITATYLRRDKRK